MIDAEVLLRRIRSTAARHHSEWAACATRPPGRRSFASTAGRRNGSIPIANDSELQEARILGRARRASAAIGRPQPAAKSQAERLLTWIPAGPGRARRPTRAVGRRRGSWSDPSGAEAAGPAWRAQPPGRGDEGGRGDRRAATISAGSSISPSIVPNAHPASLAMTTPAATSCVRLAQERAGLQPVGGHEHLLAAGAAQVAEPAGERARIDGPRVRWCRRRCCPDCGSRRRRVACSRWPSSQAPCPFTAQ